MAVLQVTCCGSQVYVGNGLGLPALELGWGPGFWPFPFWPLPFLCFAFRRFGGTRFHVPPVKVGCWNGCTPIGTNMSSA